MILAPALLGFAALIISGILFRHRHILTYLAAAAAIWETAWLLLTLITRLLVPEYAHSVFLIGAGIALGAALYTGWIRRPHIPLGRNKHDLFGEIQILLLVVGTLVGSFIIMRANGFQDHAYVTHGFFNGDVATFTALVNRSLHTSGLVRENPFAAGSDLEYPTLLHAAVAELVGGTTSTWIHLLPFMVYLTIFATIPLFFLVWEVHRPKGMPMRWVPFVIIALVVTASWDGFVYPQSHFFITGLLLLQIAFIQTAPQAQKHRTVYEIMAAAVALALLLSNAVTGTVAAAAIGLYFVWRAIDGAGSAFQRNWSWLGALAVAVSFFLFAPGEPTFGTLGFSYTAAPDMLRLSPLLLFLIFGIVRVLPKQPFSAALPTLLLAFGFITFVFSARDIVVANASRFFYYALFVAFPLMVIPLGELVGFVRSMLRQHKDIFSRTAAWGVVLMGSGLLILPSAASTASTYDNLLFQDEQVVDTAMRSALWWIEDNTAPDAVFLASPTTPFAIPALTGRSLVRSQDFWLSPQDILLEDTAAAFAGDVAAREQLYGLADYVLLTQDARAQFEPLPAMHEKVFDNGGVVIYQLSTPTGSTAQ